MHSGAFIYKDDMMKMVKHMSLAVLLVGTSLTAMPAWAAGAAKKAPAQEMPLLQMNFNASNAQPLPRAFSRYAQTRQERRITASQAKSIAMSRYRGAKFINVRSKGGGYLVRLQQKNGRIIDVYVDGRTGQVRN